MRFVLQNFKRAARNRDAMLKRQRIFRRPISAVATAQIGGFLAKSRQEISQVQKPEHRQDLNRRNTAV
jgi:hypothetical protein